MTGELVLLSGELHELDRLGDARRDVGGRYAAHAQAEVDVLGHRHVREQRVVLEHHAEAALGGSVSMRMSSSQMLPPESCISPAMQLSAVDPPHPEGPSRDELAALDGERELVERVECLAPGSGKTARDPVELELAEIVLHA
jgi:hypothetical protein